MEWTVAVGVCAALLVVNALLVTTLVRRRRLAGRPLPAVAPLPAAPRGTSGAERIARERAPTAQPMNGVTVSPDGAIRSMGGGDLLHAVPDTDPTALMDCILVSAAARTDKGLRRETNEDAVLVQNAQVFAVADGMGGHADGNVASRLALETLRGALEDPSTDASPRAAIPSRADELVRAIWKANAAVRRQAAGRAMGTTLVAARFSPNKRHVYIGNVGDSRCYRIRGGTATKLTHDHVGGAKGMRGPGARDLLRAIGAQDRLDVDVVVDRARPGDHYLLCSDGLWSCVPEQRMASIVMEAGKDLDAAVRKLVAEAVCRGTKDDVSVVLVRVDDPDEVSIPSVSSAAKLLPALGT